MKYTILLICFATLFSCRNDRPVVVDKQATPSQNDSSSTISAVERHGSLLVSGNRIVDKNGEAVQLRGMSLFWSQWMGQYFNRETVKWLKDDWNINVIRAAMAVDHGGYAENSSEKQKVFAVIDAAIEEGIYVIVDFHVHDANKFTAQSQNFFKEVATRYGSYANVIYEPWNEPVNHSWSDIIKPYHESVIDTIRKYDPDNLIVCGTRTWSQDVDEASRNPIRKNNIAYTLHFYAATHGAALRNKAKAAMDNGVALMVTEYGTCEATGDGRVDETEVTAWWNFLDENKITHCNWSVANKDESASILLPGVTKLSNWTDAELTPSGQLVKQQIKSKNIP